MYMYQDQNIIIDVSTIIARSEQLARLYGKADYAVLKEITDYIDGQTVDNVRDCIFKSLKNNRMQSD